MSQELVAIIDEHDSQITVKPRDALRPRDIIRVSVLWIENGRGDVLLQQRALTKKLHPGQWGPAVAGTVESHETYRENIIKEAEEEIGLVGVEPREVGRRLFQGEGEPFGRMFMFYKAEVDRDAERFTIQPDEVAQLKWVAKSSLPGDLRANPEAYVPSAVFWEEMYYN